MKYFRNQFEIPAIFGIDLLFKSTGNYDVIVDDMSVGLFGGKGGFGAGLKGRKRGGKKTTNFDAMRDIEGLKTFCLVILHLGAYLCWCN